MTSLDVTPGGLGVSADSEGKLKIWQTDNGEVRVCYCRLREIFLQILEQIWLLLDI